MQSKATTVEQYLASLPDDRRAAVSAVREVFRENLDRGYEEGMQYGMIGWYVPHRVFPAGYHCDPKQPLPFACLASQKGGMSIHLMGLYIGERGTDGETAESKRFRAAWTKTGKKLDMGKACVRFKKLDDLALDVLADTLRRLPVETYVGRYEANLAQSASAKGSRAKNGSGKAASASAKAAAAKVAGKSSQDGAAKAADKSSQDGAAKVADKSSTSAGTATKAAKTAAAREDASRVRSPSKARPAVRSPAAKRAR
jgi:hypothetical protein